MKNRFLKFIILSALFLALAYGTGRLYYRVTGGFTLGNISYELPYDARWEVTPPPDDFRTIVGQPFTYLGKGCQSYVFASEDGRYVIKFFKYQRFRPQSWLKTFSFIPAIESYSQEKMEKKRRKLEGVFTSWKIAYEELQPETGVVFVHLNKGAIGPTPFTLYDKMGFSRQIDLSQKEFLLQRKAKLLCPTLEAKMAEGKEGEAKELLERLVQMILSENGRGFADNDHALMQNTGVYEGQPIHIDVGQFVYNSQVKEPKLYHQELFNKTWKFRKWLEKNYPSLAEHLEMQLRKEMGDETFEKMRPRLTRGGVGALPHETRSGHQQ